ncbi:hypothetical protein GCM10017044_03220 [Kordiimonas sediminis]|uniref:Uncharacterized protein n=1 Tax=Kordiimonas sediminis TaxID=1735581 RepID=A0A919E4M1_9PROT|nr:hypothetical protein [Kordiimonas sediminis]GHF12612.1 hypothetical protein GCM10017044_03220 [Kordiimonas sediminis]
MMNDNEIQLEPTKYCDLRQAVFWVAFGVPPTTRELELLLGVPQDLHTLWESRVMIGDKGLRVHDEDPDKIKKDAAEKALAEIKNALIQGTLSASAEIVISHHSSKMDRPDKATIHSREIPAALWSHISLSGLLVNQSIVGSNLFCPLDKMLEAFDLPVIDAKSLRENCILKNIQLLTSELLTLFPTPIIARCFSSIVVDLKNIHMKLDETSTPQQLKLQGRKPIIPAQDVYKEIAILALNGEISKDMRPNEQVEKLHKSLTKKFGKAQSPDTLTRNFLRNVPSKSEG